MKIKKVVCIIPVLLLLFCCFAIGNSLECDGISIQQARKISKQILENKLMDKQYFNSASITTKEVYEVKRYKEDNPSENIIYYIDKKNGDIVNYQFNTEDIVVPFRPE